MSKVIVCHYFSWDISSAKVIHVCAGGFVGYGFGRRQWSGLILCKAEDKSARILGTGGSRPPLMALL